MSAPALLAPGDYRSLQECIHCGLCLSACPTYLVSGKEADSPRGRLTLIRYLDENAAADRAGVFSDLDLCLGCLACQDACPSGVRYGYLLDLARSHQNSRLFLRPKLIRLGLGWLTERRKLGLLTAFARMAQVSGLAKLAGRLPLLPRSLRSQLNGLPALPRYSYSSKAEVLQASIGDAKGSVALFVGCLMDRWFADVHAATVRVLRWNGYNVVLPPGQVCCGALHAHAGIEAESEALLEANRRVFREVAADILLVNAAGCSAHLGAELWNDQPGLPVADITAWLSEHLQVKPQVRLPQKVAYDAPCHLVYAQGIRGRAEELLQISVQEVVPLAESEVCCGGAGLYSLRESAMSRQLLLRKMEHLRLAAPEVLATANPGCQLQLQAGACSIGMAVPVLHVIQVLDTAYQQEEKYRQVFGMPPLSQPAQTD